MSRSWYNQCWFARISLVVNFSVWLEWLIPWNISLSLFRYLSFIRLRYMSVDYLTKDS